MGVGQDAAPHPRGLFGVIDAFDSAEVCVRRSVVDAVVACDGPSAFPGMGVVVFDHAFEPELSVAHWSGFPFAGWVIHSLARN